MTKGFSYMLLQIRVGGDLVFETANGFAYRRVRTDHAEATKLNKVMELDNNVINTIQQDPEQCPQQTAKVITQLQCDSHMQNITVSGKSTDQ